MCIYNIYIYINYTHTYLWYTSIPLLLSQHLGGLQLHVALWINQLIRHICLYIMSTQLDRSLARPLSAGIR